MPSSSTTVDPAIIRALSLEGTSSKITTHGGSGFSSTFRITTSTRKSSTTTAESPSTSIFVKTSSAPGAEVMFQGEHASLNAIHDAVPSLCPEAFAWGRLDLEPGGYFLATEFLDLGGGGGGGRRSGKGKGTGRSGTGSGMSLAEKLAKLHSTPAPVPDGHDEPQFGFPVPTCCGDTEQDNSFTSSWADFFARRRLLAVLDRGEKNNGSPEAQLRRTVERVAGEVVPKLLGDGHLGVSGGRGDGNNSKRGIVPVVVHGDLWSGNQSRGRFVGRRRSRRRLRKQNQGHAPRGHDQEKETDKYASDGDADPDLQAVEEDEYDEEEHEYEDEDDYEEVIYDPASCYAHNEYDFGIMHMFGGFGSAFWNEYHALVPKTEPVGEYDDRVRLYESYHHLNHWAIFGGGGYKGGAMRLLKGLLAKYGGGGGGE
ncbi:hypothetical protein PV08_08771 [Exophiala spinifera]|uniref:protein-ribulosamine 3-kinase n=1 Tax=Exophiala spinifera TaxID=91928 RepID=A0A0D1ZL95_9EURO|nr:uncharacterized protein PV08_08771 [Exophiala spinifera]KIW13582.1 hypothetical protein PV08_08771 [Exophiala spinifera]